MGAGLPPVTQFLIIANITAFFGELLLGPPLIETFALWPFANALTHGGDPTFQPWQIVTYAFLHAGLAHLLFNMFALFMFGGEIERLFGARHFATIYAAGVIFAAIAQLTLAAVAQWEPYPTIGASGGVFGLLLAFGMYFPRRMVMLLFPPIPMPAWLFVTLIGSLELFLGVTGTQEGVAHFAHLGGMLGAWLVIRHRAAQPRE